MRFTAIALFLLSTLSAVAGDILQKAPENLPKDGRYIFYIHGRIIEKEGPNAVSSRFGPYAFHDITAALAAEDADIIAEIRHGDTNVFDYAKTAAQTIREMIGAGVDPANITVAGFSKGGYTTLLIARELQNPAVNFVIMAGCVKGIVEGKDRNADGLKGRILSLVGDSDEFAFSCQPLIERNPAVTDYREIIYPGADHGRFYRPDTVWIDPLLSWSRR